MINITLFISFLLEKYNKLDKKYKEAVNYLIVGGLTTVVSITSYWILRLFLESYEICTIISWVFAVIFAYITNRKYVFHSRENNKLKEFIEFIISRLLSLLAEFSAMYILINLLSIDDRISKVIVQFIIIIINYIFSKLFVFKDKD